MAESTDYERVLADMTHVQRTYIERQLGNYGLGFAEIGSSGIGHVNVKEPKDNHPKARDKPLPVGFIGKYYASLTNLDQLVLKQYHIDLRSIYRAAMEITEEPVQSQPADSQEE